MGNLRQSLAVLALAMILQVMAPVCSAADCKVSLERLGLSGSSLELANDLSRLHQQIESQTNKSLRDFLRHSYQSKLNALHAKLKEEGLSISKQDLSRAIKEREPSVAAEPIETPEETLALPEAPDVPAARPITIRTRHHPDAAKGWEGRTTMAREINSLKMPSDSSSSPLALSDGTLIIGLRDGDIVRAAIDEKGEMKWLGSYKVDGVIRGSPARVRDNSFVITSSDKGIYHLQATADGKLELLGSARTEGWLDSSAVVIGDHSIVVSSRGKDLYHYEIGDTGELTFIDKIQTIGEIIGSPMLLPDGTFVVTDKDSYIYHFRLTPDGHFEKLGEMRLDGMASTPLALPSGSLVVGTVNSDAGNLYHLGFDEAGGFKVLSAVKPGVKFRSTPALLPNGDLVVDELKTGNFGRKGQYAWRSHLKQYGIDRDGKLHEKGSVGTTYLDEEFSSAPTVLPNGIVMIQSWRIIRGVTTHLPPPRRRG